ncbi:non-structural maintenance of chromosomes element 1 homolog [Sabethes cyaneus]|uniref:non-structural maintenance of chromosomes element 1 homolog n=1 Tax=Sabethes cyaneus TaxID=53552 RepID=UPI00237E002D|nr:non-structural maintenance of chromosomes element 1 homolog [Sabethes cyaneus]
MSSIYSDEHRRFVQSCMLHGSVTVENALKILTLIWAKSHPGSPAPSEETLEQVVNKANMRLLRYQHRIVRLVYDPTNTAYYVFANLSDTAMDRFQTTYPEAELSFFRVLLCELAESENHQLGQIQCLNLTGKVKGGGRIVSKNRAEELIADWITTGYLTLHNGEIRFGPRAIVEFDHYLVNHFAEHMTNCRLCKQTLFYGVKCNKCSEIMHVACLKKYIAKMKKCPACKNTWTELQ